MPRALYPPAEFASSASSFLGVTLPLRSRAMGVKPGSHPMTAPALLEEISAILGVDLSRTLRARRVAEAIRRSCSYRWVGLYDVLPEDIFVIAWAGASAPAYPRFPRTQGLCGTAVASGQTVISNDVRSDPRYLTTLGDTRSEIVVPARRSTSGPVVGLIDVESDRPGAFTSSDRQILESCVPLLTPLWHETHS